jgi:hypothetical protein
MTITDEVWQRLDPNAGKLPRRTAFRLGIAAVVALLLFVAGVAVWRTGLVVPRLAWPDGLHEWSMTPDGTARIDFLVENEGWFPVTVEGVGRSGPGMQLLEVVGGTVGYPSSDPVFPVRLAPHTGVGAVLIYRLSSCQPPAGSWPVTAQVTRPWGTMTVDVQDTSHNINSWQEELVASWCDPAQPHSQAAVTLDG